MSHDLPSGRHLADLHGFYQAAAFRADGTVSITFKVPPEHKQAITDISINDGMALNISVWETMLPEGDEWLESIIGGGTVTGEAEMEDRPALKKGSK